MKWNEYSSIVTKGHNKKYDPIIKFTKTGEATINTIFSEDKRVAGKKYYKLYTTNQNKKSIAIEFTNKKSKKCGRLCPWKGYRVTRFRFLNKEFVEEFNLYGKQIEFYWSVSDQKFIGTIP